MTDFALWGAPEWSRAALALFAVAAAVLVWSYWQASATTTVRIAAAALKLSGLAALALCLVEPLLSGVRPRPGANLFAVAVDNSQSLQIRDVRASMPRGEALERILLAESPWQTRLGQNFDVRRFVFDANLRDAKEFDELSFTGEATALGATLHALARRFRGLPIGGVLLLTDGNSTDAVGDSLNWSDLPPVYPVVVGNDAVLPDLRVEDISLQQTNFESAPVAISAEVRRTGEGPRQIAVQVLDEDHRAVESQTIELAGDDAAEVARFQLRPKHAGINFFEVRVSGGGEAPKQGELPSHAEEATLANNRRMVVVEHGAGPYRILYVSGRPNWDFKFLRRALADDDQLELVGLVRIARREPKFTFRRRGEGSGNQLFEGFLRDDEDTAERHDEPVLTRLGTRDDQELRDGFPKSADELFQYDAMILDDVEAAFFTADQHELIESFVSRRGGGFLMLSGVESFADGGYQRTPVGSLLPIYLDRPGADSAALADSAFRLALTREGWLQDWVRLRKTEEDDRLRLRTMPDFRTISAVGNLKPGAVELAHVVDSAGKTHPALVAQRFGRGRAAAVLIGDMWRWGMRRPEVANDDVEKSWRQTVRWLVADVPRRVQAEPQPADDDAGGPVDVLVRVHDQEYLPLENAVVAVKVTTPDGKQIELAAEASDQEPGRYLARCPSRTPGPYRAAVEVVAPDGSPVGQHATGWVAQPRADEFRRLRPNRALLEEIADKTAGRTLELEELNDFVASLERREMPVTETWIRPLWHSPMFFLFAVTCLIGEWGLRRWKGLA